MRTFFYQGVPEPYYDSASPTVEAQLAKANLGGLSGVALDVGHAGVVSVALPVNPDDVATKEYVDGVAKGINIHAPAKVISDTNVNLSSAPALLDGVLLVLGDRVLIAGQTDPSENGIYIFNGVGAALTRADDGVDPYFKGGDYFFISEGVSFSHTAWVLFTSPPITTGTTPLDFRQFAGLGQVVVGGGLTKTGNQIDVGKGNGIRVDSDSISLDLAVNPALALVGTSPEKLLAWKPDTARGLDRHGAGAMVRLAPTSSGLRFTDVGDIDLKTDVDGALKTGLNGLYINIATEDELYFDLGYLRVSGVPKNFRVNGTPTSSYVTADLLTQLTSGGSGDNLHSHSPPPELPGTVEYWVASGPITRGQGVYISSSGVVSACSALDPVQARCIGVADSTVSDGQTLRVIPVGIVRNILGGATIGTRFFINHLGRPVNIAAVPKGARLVQMGIALTENDLMVQLHDYGTHRASESYTSNVLTNLGEIITDSSGAAVTI